MAQDLGARLLREGLVDRDQLADALAEGAAGGVLVSALLRHGLDEDELHRLLVREGHPEASYAELEAGSGAVSRLLHGRMAHTLQALPIEDRGHEVVVAMVDPSDSHAIRELRFAVGRMVRAKVARATDLRNALASAYPGDIPPVPRETPLALIRRRSPSGSIEAPRTPKRRRTRPMESIPPRSSPPPRAPSPLAQPSSHPPERTSSTPPGTTRSSMPPSAGSILTLEESSWGDLQQPPGPVPAPRTPQERRPSSVIPPPVGPTLASLRRASDRDSIVRLTCDGCAGVAKTVVFLALRRGVLRGWEARGGHVSADAIRNLWIPATSPSMFQRVLEHGESYEGSYGTTAADDLFRAATGSRGGRVTIHPVRVGGKPLGALCAEGVRYGENGKRRVEELVLAAGRAFERLLAHH